MLHHNTVPFIEPPGPSCPSLNTANCSKYTWNSVAMVTFSGTQLERIIINEGNSVLIKHENLTGVVGLGLVGE
jgi:hypothetical protein